MVSMQVIKTLPFVLMRLQLVSLESVPQSKECGRAFCALHLVSLTDWNNSFILTLCSLYSDNKFGVGGRYIQHPQSHLLESHNLFILLLSGLKAKRTKRKEKIKDKNVENVN